MLFYQKFKNKKFRPEGEEGGTYIHFIILLKNTEFMAK